MNDKRHDPLWGLSLVVLGFLFIIGRQAAPAFQANQLLGTLYDITLGSCHFCGESDTWGGWYGGRVMTPSPEKIYIVSALRPPLWGSFNVLT